MTQDQEAVVYQKLLEKEQMKTRKAVEKVELKDKEILKLNREIARSQALFENHKKNSISNLKGKANRV